MDEDIRELIQEMDNDLSFSEDDKELLLVNCKNYMEEQMEVMRQIKLELVYKKFNIVLNLIGDRICEQFNLDKELVNALINAQLLESDLLKLNKLEKKLKNKDLLELIEEEEKNEEVKNEEVKNEEIKNEEVKKKDEKKVEIKNKKSKKKKEEKDINKDNEEENSIKEMLISQGLCPIKNKTGCGYCKRKKTNGIYCGYHRSFNNI